MNDEHASGADAWADATLAAALFAIDPQGLGGVRVRARAGPVRDRWLATLRAALGARPAVRLPPGVAPERLVGGLDLAATLRSGRPVMQRGLLVEADGGALIVPMAERLEPGTAATIATVQDRAHVETGDGGDAALGRARFGVVALEEAAPGDEPMAACLLDRLALRLDLDAIAPRTASAVEWSPAGIDAARARLAAVRVGDEAFEAICAGALGLGIDSLRAPVLAVRAARAHAAFAGREDLDESDIAAAARLVLAPRATTWPEPPGEAGADPESGEAEAPPEAADDESTTGEGEAQPDPSDGADTPEPEAGDGPGQQTPPSGPEDEPEEAPAESEASAEVVLEAARAVLPEGLLDPAGTLGAARGPAGAAGRAGALQGSGRRGRPAGVRRGMPGPEARLNVIETLRAAAPWQPLRRAERGERTDARVDVRREDLRVSRYRTHRETATLFVVDASGSAALHRLAEAKGAVELLLADCYVRRDRVALISFRGNGAELLLPPTRSLVRAKRQLAELPGGGGTALAAGLEAAERLARQVARDGMTPTIVLLTDGRANVALDGTRDRDAATRDALAAGRRLRAGGIASLLVDTAPRGRTAAQELAEAMGARHLPLPYGDAARLSSVVREAIE